MLNTLFLFTGKSAGCPAFLPLGRGGEEGRPYKHIFISGKPRPVGGELHPFLLVFDPLLLDLGRLDSGLCCPHAQPLIAGESSPCS